MPETRTPGTRRSGEGPGRLSVDTDRLRVTALTWDALQAWADGDADRLGAETGARFEVPVATPPLFRENLPSFRDRMAETPDELGWWVWLISRLEDGRAVGVCGLGGRPDLTGATVLGYAVYPHQEGRGYATEASRAVMAWALGQSGVRCVRATVPIGNLGSVAVARKLGMIAVGTEEHAEVGQLVVYEIRRPPEPGTESAAGWGAHGACSPPASGTS